MPIDREKVRIVTIPILTWRNLKRTSVELEKPMTVLLSDAWKEWSEQRMVVAK